MRYAQMTLAISMAAVLWVCASGTTLPAAPLQESEAGEGRAGRGMLCEERPAGRATGVGNTQLYNICIAPLPPAAAAVGDQICEQAFGGLFRAVADLEALVNCMTLHNVQCIQRDCPNPCQNSVSETSAGGAFYDAQGFYCRNNAAAQQRGWTAACRMGPASYDCDCSCPPPPQQVQPEVVP